MGLLLRRDRALLLQEIQAVEHGHDASSPAMGQCIGLNIRS
jgi:hypothetical protein